MELQYDAWLKLILHHMANNFRYIFSRPKKKIAYRYELAPCWGTYWSVHSVATAPGAVFATRNPLLLATGAPPYLIWYLPLLRPVMENCMVESRHHSLQLLHSGRCAHRWKSSSGLGVDKERVCPGRVPNEGAHLESVRLAVDAVSS